MSTNVSRRSPQRGRFFDELTDPSAKPTPLPATAPPKSGVDEANYRLLIDQLVLCNDEIERLLAMEERLTTENAQLKQALELYQGAPRSSEASICSEATPVHDAVQNPRPVNECASEGSKDSSPPPALRPYLGIEVMDTGSEVVVKNILPGGGADEAGVQVNDVLLKWNGDPIGSRQEFGLLVSQAQIGSMVKLHIERGPKHQSLVLRVEVKGTAGPKSSPAKPAHKGRNARPSSTSPIKPGASGMNRLNGALN